MLDNNEAHMLCEDIEEIKTCSSEELHAWPVRDQHGVTTIVTATIPRLPGAVEWMILPHNRLI